MESVLSLNHVTKKYKDFCLKDVELTIPPGMIFGIIGENGAGKTTTIKAVLDMIKIDSGEIKILGKDYRKCVREVKQEIGVVMDGIGQNPYLYCKDLDSIFKRIYKNWNSERYFSLLERFDLPGDKKIKELSKGMNVKLNFAVAMAYDPKLLILDEATSGLDPVMRDEILEVLQEFVIDGGKSVLMSTHITSDLDKIADYIVFIHKGRLKFIKSKEDIDNNYGVLHCRKAFFDALAPADYDAYIREEFSYKVLLNNKYETMEHFKDLTVDKASIEDIMLFYIKGEHVCED
ncbi:MAG: ABC transporter ATP-binding protein [Clostridiales bacterium]|nr:ABC transporter ATP-binding protein [Clostridiales bacterium]